MLSEYATLINFLIGSGLAGLGTTGIIKLFKYLKNKYLESRTKKGLILYSESKTIVKDLFFNCPSLNRITVNIVSNGGGIPGPFNIPKITILDEKCSKDVLPMIDNVQARTADAFYCNSIILPTLLKGEVVLNIEELPNNIKDMYIANRHQSSKTVLIAKNPTSFIYLVAMSPGDINSLSPTEKEFIRDAVNKLNKIYRI